MLKELRKILQFFLEMEPKLRNFFTRCILPQVLRGGDNISGRDVSGGGDRNRLDMSGGDDASGQGDVYCFCRKGEFGQMIACDNPFCPYEWFHFSCVNITSEPDGNWFCSSCK